MLSEEDVESHTFKKLEMRPATHRSQLGEVERALVQEMIRYKRQFEAVRCQPGPSPPPCPWCILGTGDGQTQALVRGGVPARGIISHGAGESAEAPGARALSPPYRLALLAPIQDAGIGLQHIHLAISPSACAHADGSARVGAGVQRA